MTSESMTPELAPVNAHVVGIVRGKEIDAQAALGLEDLSLTIVWSSATPWRLSLEGIDGLTLGTAQITIYLTSGDVLEFTGDDRLRTFGQQLLDRACAIPELTRGLRELGSRRGVVGATHDAWFAPLLHARRSVEGITDPLRQSAVVDGRRLSETYVSVLSELAAIQAPADPAAQRAIEAVLEEEAEPLFSALNHMALAADAMLGGALDTRLLDWRRWMETVRAVFTAADEAWGRSAPYLR